MLQVGILEPIIAAKYGQEAKDWENSADIFSLLINLSFLFSKSHSTNVQNKSIIHNFAKRKTAIVTLTQSSLTQLWKMRIGLSSRQLMY